MKNRRHSVRETNPLKPLSARVCRILSPEEGAFGDESTPSREAAKTLHFSGGKHISSMKPLRESVVLPSLDNTRRERRQGGAKGAGNGKGGTVDTSDTVDRPYDYAFPQMFEPILPSSSEILLWQ